MDERNVVREGGYHRARLPAELWDAERHASRPTFPRGTTAQPVKPHIFLQRGWWYATEGRHGRGICGYRRFVAVERYLRTGRAQRPTTEELRVIYGIDPAP